jgi:hypothetical protein
MLRPMMPPAVGIVLANTAIHIGHGTMLIACSRMMGRPDPAGPVMLLVLAATVAFIYYAVVDPENVAVRVIITSVVIGAFLAGSALQFFRAANPETIMIRRALGATMMIGAAFLLARAFITYRRGAAADVMSSDPIHTGVSLVSIVLAFGYVVGMILLVGQHQQTRLSEDRSRAGT